MLTCSSVWFCAFELFKPFPECQIYLCWQVGNLQNRLDPSFKMLQIHLSLNSFAKYFSVAIIYWSHCPLSETNYLGWQHWEFDLDITLGNSIFPCSSCSHLLFPYINGSQQWLETKALPAPEYSDIHSGRSRASFLKADFFSSTITHNELLTCLYTESFQ